MRNLLCSSILFSLFTFTSWADTFIVNTTSDGVDVNRGNGICATASGQCSLRAAIQEANAKAGADIITLPAGTYTLTLAGTLEDASATGDLDVTETLTLNGAGRTTTVIDGNGIDRVFEIPSVANFTISGVTIRNGNVTGFGGGIDNSETGTLAIFDSTITGNNASRFGGGVNNNLGGTVTITNSSVTNNTTGNGFGGGINNNSNGFAAVINSIISGNTAGGSGFGGGINNNFNGVLIVDLCVVSGNKANGFGGGGINNNFNGSATVTHTRISSNTAQNGGGINNNSSGTLTVSNSTISGNSGSGSIGGGGILNNGSGPMTITNSTISGNSFSATSGINAGGGLANNGSGSVAILNSTFFNNSAAKGGGIYVNSSGTVSLKNSIVANTPAGGNCSGNPTLPASRGNNLSSDASCNFTGPGDLQNTDPRLGPLKDNGGPTLTHAPLCGSPAIDAGDNDACCAVDQRGVARPADGNQDSTAGCDIGAFEATVDCRILFPTVVTGGNAAGTTLVATNPLGAAAGLRLRAFAPDGTPLALSFTSGAAGSDLQVQIPARSTITLTTVRSQPAALTSGWIRLDPTGELTTVLIFSLFSGTALVTEAGVLNSPARSAFHLPVDTQGEANTGIAFANPLSEAVTLTLILYDQSGNKLAEKTIVLPAGNQLARFATDIFDTAPGIQEFLGAISVSVAGGKKIPAVALRQTGLIITVVPLSEGAVASP